jgi:hypothetical protein
LVQDKFLELFRHNTTQERRNNPIIMI